MWPDSGNRLDQGRPRCECRVHHICQQQAEPLLCWCPNIGGFSTPAKSLAIKKGVTLSYVSRKCSTHVSLQIGRMMQCWQRMRTMTMCYAHDDSPYMLSALATPCHGIPLLLKRICEAKAAEGRPHSLLQDCGGYGAGRENCSIRSPCLMHKWQ